MWSGSFPLDAVPLRKYFSSRHLFPQLPIQFQGYPRDFTGENRYFPRIRQGCVEGVEVPAQESTANKIQAWSDAGVTPGREERGAVAGKAYRRAPDFQRWKTKIKLIYGAIKWQEQKTEGRGAGKSGAGPSSIEAETNRVCKQNFYPENKMINADIVFPGPKEPDRRQFM